MSERESEQSASYCRVARSVGRSVGRSGVGAAWSLATEIFHFRV